MAIKRKYLFEGKMLSLFAISMIIDIYEGTLSVKKRKAEAQGVEINEKWFKSLIINKKELYCFGGKELTLREISQLINIKYYTLISKMRKARNKGIKINEEWFRSLFLVYPESYFFEGKKITVSNIAKKLNKTYASLNVALRKANVGGVKINEKRLKSLYLPPSESYFFGENNLTVSEISNILGVKRDKLIIEIEKGKNKGVKINDIFLKKRGVLLSKKRFIYFYYNYRTSQENISYIEYLKQNKIIFNEKLFKEMLSSLNLELFKNPNLNIRRFIEDLDIRL